MYYSTKFYDHSCGFSIAYRQWKANSHCRHIHGYSIAVKFVFGTNELDCRNWAIDFGSMKSLKSLLEDNFDHTLLVSEDDPFKDELCALAGLDVAKVIVLPALGCEKFAEYIFECTEIWLKDNGYAPRCWLESVEVSEHSGNSAIYKKE